MVSVLIDLCTVNQFGSDQELAAAWQFGALEKLNAT